MIKKNKKVIIAMSGGVDSSVAAYLLKNQGYDVIGVFVRFWSPEDKKERLCDFENLCCSAKAKEIAEKTARVLDIPFYVMDAREFFKKKVVDYFIKEYESGKTPNPCIRCGKYIKFDFLHNKVRRTFDADFVATGHYAQVVKRGNYYFLKGGRDQSKDQSYFLYTATQDTLSHFLFPVGNMLKSEVRNVAKKAQLPSFKRPESQEICFVPNNDYSDFLTKYGSGASARGDIVSISGQKMGEHKGIQNFTIGQRKGLGIAGKVPFYVVRLDAKKNEVVIGEKKDLLIKSFVAKKVNWISGEAPKEGALVQAKIRYGSNPEKAKIYGHKDIVNVEFIKPVSAVAPGQSVVFYNKDIVLGGGIIS